MVTGRQIGGYQILEELGRGAMGVVFKARQVSMDRIVAIKFLPKKLAQDERIVARFLREARAAGQLTHPNIVSVHELGLAEGLHFIAMEYVDGNSIQRKIKDKGPLSEKESLEIALQIAEALKLAHSRGILHRDIKPDNFLIDSAGRVRLADLGLALIQSNPDGGLTQDGTTLGTPHFMSPEQCSGTGVDARSDLYSLGASIFVMSSGRTPYEGSSAAAVMVKVLTEPPLSLKKLRPELSAGFVALVEKMMSKDPAKRFQDAQSAVDAIQQCKSGLYKAVVTPKTMVANKSATAGKTTGKAQGLASASPAQAHEKPGTRNLTAHGSKVIPLMLGAGAAMFVLLLLFFASRGKTQSGSVQMSAAALPTAAKIEAPESHAPFIGMKAMDDGRTGGDDLEKHPHLRKQLREWIEDLRTDKIKFTTAQRNLNDLLKKLDLEDKKGAVVIELRLQINRLQRDIDLKQRLTAEEWKKVDGKANLLLKDAHINDALIALSDFQIANEGSEEALRAGERIVALCSGFLSRADKIAAAGNYKDALALLISVTAKLPAKEGAAFRTDMAKYEECIKVGQELADCYDRALKRALYYDPVARTCFQFSEAAKICAEGAVKARSESNRADMLELAELFKAADKILLSFRGRVLSKPVELASLGNFNNVKVTQWDEKGLVYSPSLINLPPQPYTWDSTGAADVVLHLAKELDKGSMDKPECQWEVGVLAFALGQSATAAKLLREAASDSPYKGQAHVALKLLKPFEQTAVVSDKPDSVTTVSNSSTAEDDARQLFKEFLDAKKADNKDKMKTIKADFDAKYATTDFAKTHKKDLDDAGSVPAVAAVDPVKVPEPAKLPDKPKADLVPSEEKEARDLLKKSGWTEVTGSWAWDKEKQALRVDGIAEATNPATESDISVRFRLLDSTAKLRVLARVDKAGADRFALFGTKTSLGFGTDIGGDHAYVYLDYQSRRGRVKDPIQCADVKLESRAFHVVDLSFHSKDIAVTFDGGKPEKSAGDARATGDTRIIVNGPALIYAARISVIK